MPERLQYRLYRLIWTGLDWLYPPECGGCGKFGMRWCADCAAQVNEVQPPLCPVCGHSQTDAVLCAQCAMQPPLYAALRSWGVFGGVLRQAIHELKYKKNLALADVLACSLIMLVRRLEWDAHLVIPVPLALARKAERGYNQSSLLAYPLSLAQGLSYQPAGLQRIRETHAQVDLSAEERKKNVMGAFRADPDVVAGKNVIVVDDVTTTGSTMSACAAALLDAGVNKVFGLTLARSVIH